MEQNTRKVGTVSRGIRCPIIRQGDDLAQIVTDSVLEAAEIEGFEIRDRDVISITESIVARAQGNYAAVTARAKGMSVIGLTGEKESALSAFADVCIRVPRTMTYQIQELHLPVYHCLCLMLEEAFFGGAKAEG